MEVPEASRCKSSMLIDRRLELGALQREGLRHTQQTRQTCHCIVSKMKQNQAAVAPGHTYCRVWARALSLSPRGKLAGGGGGMVSERRAALGENRSGELYETPSSTRHTDEGAGQRDPVERPHGVAGKKLGDDRYPKAGGSFWRAEAGRWSVRRQRSAPCALSRGDVYHPCNHHSSNTSALRRWHAMADPRETVSCHHRPSDSSLLLLLALAHPTVPWTDRRLLILAYHLLPYPLPDARLLFGPAGT